MNKLKFPKFKETTLFVDFVLINIIKFYLWR